MPTLVIFIALLLAPAAPTCSCRTASEDDVPHGANEIYEIRLGTVKKIQGTVLLPDDTLAGDIVVELYDLPATKVDAYDFVREHSRRVACVTSADGSFCFTNLPSGNYLLRAGTRQQDGFNELYARVTVDRSWFRGLFRRSKSLRLTLSLGT
jgi:hypothetical protein